MRKGLAFARRKFILGVSAWFVPFRLSAQTRPKVVAILNPYSSVAVQAGLKVFRDTLSDLGYSDTRQIVFVERSTEGRNERLEPLALELVRLAPDVIFVSSTVAAAAVQKATASVPVVFITVSDPVGAGFAVSLGRPGRNFTGLSNFALELDAKRLDLLRQIAPAVARVAVLGNPSTSASPSAERRLAPAFEQLGMRAKYFGVQSQDDLDRAFEELSEWGAQAVYASPDPLLWIARRRVAALAVKYKLPSMFSSGEYVEAGGLASYGADQLEPVKRAAVYVDKILKGARAGDLPIEQPTRVELIINKRTASELQLKIPAQALIQAERILE